MKTLGLLVVLLFIISCSHTAKILHTGGTVSYDGYKAMEIVPKSGEHVEILKALEIETGMDFWMAPSGAGSIPATAMIAPALLSQVRETLRQHNIPFNVTMKNVGRMFEQEKQLQSIASRLIKKENLKIDLSHMLKYLRYAEIESTLRGIADEHNQTATLVEIGKSFEQRPIFMMKMSNNPSAHKPIAFIEAGMHAREWLAPALALHTINRIIQDPKLLDNQDWYIVPSANPDGYEYSHTKDRLWRKTRSYRPNISKHCVGSDPNRNFDIVWAKVGTSANPCDETYPGKAAFSESETRALRDVMHKLHKRVRTYLSIHSFGRLILYPWGYTTLRANNWSHLNSCGEKAAKAIGNSQGPYFTVGSPAEILYSSAGASDDYMMATYNVPYAFTVELQGGGSSGFDPPPSAIHKMVEEAFPGIVTLATCWQGEQDSQKAQTEKP